MYTTKWEIKNKLNEAVKKNLIYKRVHRVTVLCSEKETHVQRERWRGAVYKVSGDKLLGGGRYQLSELEGMAQNPRHKGQTPRHQSAGHLAT